MFCSPAVIGFKTESTVGKWDTLESGRKFDRASHGEMTLEPISKDGISAVADSCRDFRLPMAIADSFLTPPADPDYYMAVKRDTSTGC